MSLGAASDGSLEVVPQLGRHAQFHLQGNWFSRYFFAQLLEGSQLIHHMSPTDDGSQYVLYASQLEVLVLIALR